MEYNSQTIEILRMLIDEEIPINGTEQDTRFTDEMLGQILANSKDINEAAYICWIRKAGKAIAEKDGIKGIKVGSEEIEYVTPEEYREHCLKMAEIYKELSEKLHGGSRAYSFDPPNVLYPEE